jgi:hypothetical protein
MTRLTSLLTFLAILVACIAGAFTLSWWLACAAAAMLVLVSLAHHEPAYKRYAPSGGFAAQSMLLLASTLNAATAAGAGFAFGRAAAVLLGVA